MRPSEVFQEYRQMRFEKVYTGWKLREIPQEQAACIRWMSDRTYRRLILFSMCSLTGSCDSSDLCRYCRQIFKDQNPLEEFLLLRYNRSGRKVIKKGRWMPISTSLIQVNKYCKITIIMFFWPCLLEGGEKHFMQTKTLHANNFN